MTRTVIDSLYGHRSYALQVHVHDTQFSHHISHQKNPSNGAARREPGKLSSTDVMCAANTILQLYPTMTESDHPVAPSTIVVEWLARFASALEAADADAVADMFLPHGWFKDVLTFTWDMRALRGPGQISSYLHDNMHGISISSVKLDTDPYFTPHVIPGSEDSMIESAFRFETPIADGRGYVQLARDQDTWQAQLVCMTLVDLKGHEEPVGPPNWEGEANGRPWSEVHAEHRRRNESDPYALISQYLPSCNYWRLICYL